VRASLIKLFNFDDPLLITMNCITIAFGCFYWMNFVLSF